MRAGDILYTVNGEYVTIEKVQHEILEVPVKVYNFRVANNHTYFVGHAVVGVHNAYDYNAQEGGVNTEPENKLPTRNDQLKHIFKNKEDHYAEGTPEVRATIEDVANDPNCKLGLIQEEKRGMQEKRQVENKYGLSAGTALYVMQV